MRCLRQREQCSLTRLYLWVSWPLIDHDSHDPPGTLNNDAAGPVLYDGGARALNKVPVCVCGTICVGDDAVTMRQSSLLQCESEDGCAIIIGAWPLNTHTHNSNGVVLPRHWENARGMCEPHTAICTTILSNHIRQVFRPYISILTLSSRWIESCMNEKTNYCLKISIHAHIVFRVNLRKTPWSVTRAWLG